MARLSRALLLTLLLGPSVTVALEERACPAGARLQEPPHKSVGGLLNGTAAAENSSTPQPRLCGEWCDAAAEAETPCAIDQVLRSCRGDLCTTTCGLWAMSMLGDRNTRKVPCAQFIRGHAYPWGAEVCREECLLPEIRADRYPEPTGLGFLCRPGTCDPAAQSRYENTSAAMHEGLAVLECPCNWFGADCQEDLLPVRAVHKSVLGDVHVTRLAVGADAWRRVVEGHRPGGVVRVRHFDAGGVLREQPYALANGFGGQVGELEILAGPPSDGLFPSVTEVARRVRALPNGAVSNLFVNPSVSGFFNRHYTFLTEALPGFKHVVLVAAGTGLAGVPAAVAEALAAGSQVHVFYGLRDVRHLPYRALLEGWAATAAAGNVTLTLLVSGTAPAARQVGPQEPGLAAAVARGEELERLAGRRLYAQDAMALSFEAGDLRALGAGLRGSAVVVCGRPELVRGVPRALRTLCLADLAGGNVEECEALLAKNFFTNI